MAGTDALPPDSFAQAFIGERPKAATSALASRLKRSDLIAASISSYIRERAAIEADYSKRLHKLSSKGHIVPDSYGLTHDSGLDAVLTSLENELATQARIQDSYASRLETNVAAALKDAGKASEAAYKSNETSAQQIAKEFEDASSKLSKAQSGKSTFRKGGDVTKLQSDVDSAQDDWMTEAPPFLNAAQKAETSRLEGIQQNLAKFQTLASDLAREKMELSERSLLQILGWDISADLQTFLLKEGTAGAISTTRPSRPQQQQQQPPQPAAGGLGEGPLNESSASIRSGQSSARNQPTGAAPKEKTGFLSSIRNKKMNPLSSSHFGGGALDKPSSIQNRGRSHSSAADSYGQIDEEGISSTARAPPSSVAPSSAAHGGGGFDDPDSNEIAGLKTSMQPDVPQSSASDDGFAAQGSGKLAPIATSSGPSLGRSASKRESKMPSFFQRKSSQHNMLSNFRPGSSSAGSGSGPAGGELLAAPEGGQSESEPNSPATFGEARQPTSPSGAQMVGSPSSPPPAGSLAATQQRSNSNPFAQQGLAGMMAPKQSSQTRVDSEGYSIPPEGHDAQPWASSNRAGDLMDEPEPMATSNLPKVDIQPDSSAPRESEADKQAALQRVQSALQASGPSAARRSTVSRGRRSTVQSMLVTSPSSIPDDAPLRASQPPLPTDAAENISRQASPAPAAPVSPTGFGSSPHDVSMPGSPSQTAPVPGRAASIVSTAASVDGVHGATSNPFDNPNGEGLRASIAETLSVLSKQGQQPRVQVLGELALHLNPTELSVDQVTMRIARGEQLSRLQPNKTLINSFGDGSFTINVKALQEACHSHHGPVVALKYHLQLNANEVAQALPLHLNSQWKCEPSQTSLIITYRGNSESLLANSSDASPFSETQAIKDLSLAVPITSAGVSQVQSRPAAMFNPERKRLLWKLDDLPLQNEGAGENKVLARFQVGEQSTPQPVAVRWNIPGRLISSIGLDLSSVDGSPLPEVLHNFQEISLRTVSGKYLCQ